MTRALDHLVLAFHDLEAAAERYRRLGFQVSQRNRHPWGTENHIVQFDGAFLELVGLGAGFARPAPDDPVFPFSGFIADFLQSREGLAMLVLRSPDAEADRLSFAAQGIGDRPRFDFARRGQRDGREVDVAFSLAFARAPASLQAGFFTCEQRFPENFWDQAAQVHPNGATGVAELDVAHPQPEIVAPFLSAYLGAAPAESEGDLRFALEKTVVTLSASTPAGLRAARIAARGGLMAID